MGWLRGRNFARSLKDSGHLATASELTRLKVKVPNVGGYR